MTGNEWEKTVYLGLVNIALLAWLIMRRKRLDRELIAFVFGGMGVFAVFASGSHLHVLGRSTIPLPDLLLSYLPFFKNVRGPSRAIVLVIFSCRSGSATRSRQSGGSMAPPGSAEARLR